MYNVSCATLAQHVKGSSLTRQAYHVHQQVISPLEERAMEDYICQNHRTGLLLVLKIARCTRSRSFHSRTNLACFFCNVL
jgi:hypothetical protein